MLDVRDAQAKAIIAKKTAKRRRQREDKQPTEQEAQYFLKQIYVTEIPC